MSFDFAIKAGVVFHEVRFLGLRVLLSSARGGIDIGGNCSIDVHMISSLRGGASSIVVASSIIVFSLVIVVPSVILFGEEFECLEEPLACLGELGCHLPFEMRFAGLFFPLLEGPWGLCSRVEVGGINDGTSESFGHAVFESFNSSLVI